MQMKLRLLLLACMTVLLSLGVRAATTAVEGAVNAQKSAGLGGVSNNETRKPMSNVSITAYLSSKSEKVVLTNNNGTYTFDELKGGTYKFVFEKDGYKKVVKEKIVVRQAEGFQLDVEMEEHTVFDFMPGPFHFSDLD